MALILETLFLATCCGGASSSAAAAAPDFSALSRDVDTAVAQKNLPSIVAVVFDERRILWSRTAGLADIERKQAPTLRTRYRLGSMAKAVTSTVWAMAEQKRVTSFDATVSVNAAAGLIRVPVRELVNMRAGLAQAVCYDGITGDADPDCADDFDRHFAVAMTDGRDRYSYSNMGPELAADALAQRIGRPFEQIARDLLFSPAGMVTTTYDHSRPGVRAAGYDSARKAYEHEFRILPPAGAGLESSAMDLVRFGQLHLTGRGADGRPLLTRRTLALLHSAPNDGFYGYGWGRIGTGKPTEVLIADGQVNGGQAMLLINAKRGFGALVMANAANDEVSELALKAIDSVVPGTLAAFARDVETARTAHQAKMDAFLPPSDFKAEGFVGVGNTKLPIKAVVQSNRLSVTVAGKSSEQAQPEEDEGFRGWSIPCPDQLPACARPGASAKLWLSRDSGTLGGQVQVTNVNGQLPYVVGLSLH